MGAITGSVAHRAELVTERGSTRRPGLPGHILDVMPSLRPSYKICPGDRLEVEVVQPDGGRALVIGKLDAVPEAAGGRALRIVVCDAQITVLPAR